MSWPSRMMSSAPRAPGIGRMPPHRLGAAGVYFLTARTSGRKPLLESDGMKDWFQEQLLAVAAEFGWRLEAWAVLSNHYHFVGHSPVRSTEAARSLRARPSRSS